MDIVEVNRVIKDFLKRIIGVDGKIIKTSRTEEGWEAVVEVIDESDYIKKLGLPTTVFDRNTYELKLNDNLEVLSYERVTAEQLAARSHSTIF